MPGKIKIILLLAVVVQALAIPAARTQSSFIQRIRISHPLKEPMFNTMQQDSRGFLWLGSDEGLFRFDGNSLQQYPEAGDSLDLKVTALAEAPDGSIWIGCKDGRIFHITSGQLVQFDPEEGTASVGISDIVFDREGTTWWSTLGEGIYYYRDNRVTNINQDDGLEDDYVYDLEMDSTGTIWAGTDAGIAGCRLKEGKKVVDYPDVNRLLPDIIVRVIKVDGKGNLLVGFQDNGFGYVSADRQSFSAPESGASWKFGPVNDLLILRDRIWASTENGNLLEIKGNKIQTVHFLDESGAVTDHFGKLSDLLLDSERNVWIAAGTELFRSTGSKINYYTSAGGEKIYDIHAIYHDNKGYKLWFSDDAGLHAVDLVTGTRRNFLSARDFPDIKVTSIATDNYGFIWAGTFNFGVFRINPASGASTRITEKDGLVNNNVLSISVHNDTLWMATLGGASEIELESDGRTRLKSIRSYDRSNGLVSNYIYAVYEDRKDNIWFATDGDGIAVMRNDRFMNYGKSDGLGDDIIYSIVGDDLGNIWIATSQAGVYRFDGKNFRNFGMAEGLSSQQITGLKSSGDEIIVVMENGIDIIRASSGNIIHYGEEVGLSGISPDLNVISTDPEGNVWIGTRKGIICYQPGRPGNAGAPKTIIEQMAVFLKPVEMKPGLVLGSAKNNVSFQYTGIWLSNPDQVSFQVMLEGYDLEWKNSFDRFVSYSSLPSGNYTFKVKSSANQSFANATEAIFSFRIRKPFWASPWFIIAMVLLLGGLVYLFIRYREKRLKRLEEEKKEKIEFEFRLLKNQVNPHFIFNSFSTLMSLIEEQPSQALEYTEKLSDFFRAILQIKDDAVIPLKEELNFLDNYYYLLKKRFGDNLLLEINLPGNTLESLVPPMTFQILTENAVKHNVISRDMPLKISIYMSDDHIVFENNLQLKLVPELSTGLGLENITKRYRLKTDKEIIIEESKEYFRVYLPLVNR